MAEEFMYWNDLIGLSVRVAGQGRLAGTVEDFYYDPTTQSVPALRIKTRLAGSRVLLVSALAALDRDGVTVANENMLIDENNAGGLGRLPRGQRLLDARVISEKGHELGVVSNLLFGVSPLAAMRISSFEVGRQRGQRISAHAITHIGEDTLTVIE